MVVRIINNLKTKPRHVRDQYAFLIAVAFTLIVGGVWSLSLPSRLGQVIPSELSVATSTPPSAPLSNFFSQFKNQFANVSSADKNNENVSGEASTTSNQSENALNMRLTEENKESLNTSTSTYTYDDSEENNPSTAVSSEPTILIGTSSATGTTAE